MYQWVWDTQPRVKTLDLSAGNIVTFAPHTPEDEEQQAEVLVISQALSDEDDTGLLWDVKLRRVSDGKVMTTTQHVDVYWAVVR